MRWLEWQGAVNLLIIKNWSQGRPAGSGPSGALFMKKETPQNPGNFFGWSIFRCIYLLIILETENAKYTYSADSVLFAWLYFAIGLGTRLRYPITQIGRVAGDGIIQLRLDENTSCGTCASSGAGRRLYVVHRTIFFRIPGF